MSVLPSGSAESPPLRISYLFSQFPVPTQVFAVSDINSLRALGHEVVVHTVKTRDRNEEKHLRVCDVPPDLAIRRPSLRGAMRWPKLLWKMRGPVTYLVCQILRQAMRSPGVALTALLSIPRVIEMADEVLKLDADVVHAFWSRHGGMVLAVLGMLGARSERSAFVGAYDLVADDFLVDLALRWSEVAFSHAEANRNYVESKVPHNIPVNIVHRGIPLLALDESLERDPNLWITASSLALPKNVEGVLQAFALARRSRPDLKLEIYGEGPDRSRLEQCSRDLGCADAVRFCGHVRREDLFHHMQHAAVFLILSKKASERLPNVVKEALWAGCAIISSNSDGIGALIPDNSVGHVVAPDDASAVASAVQSVLAEAPQQADLRDRKGRKIIATGFSSELGMREYVAAWHRIRAAREEQPFGEEKIPNVA